MSMSVSATITMFAGTEDFARCAIGGPEAGFSAAGAPCGNAEDTGPVIRAAIA